VYNSMPTTATINNNINDIHNIAMDFNGIKYILVITGMALFTVVIMFKVEIGLVCFTDTFNLVEQITSIKAIKYCRLIIILLEIPKKLARVSTNRMLFRCTCVNSLYSWNNKTNEI